jgi:SAM-dependent methyltransferase
VSELTPHEESVARHYGGPIFEYERDRLTRHSPVELTITLRYLSRYIPDGSTVADVGVGVGHYAEALGRRGCSLHLVDVTQELIDATVARIREAGLAGRVLDVRQASATRLDHLAAASCDAVLLLGPLYHLCTLAEREQAVAEAARVLRPGGVLCAAGINRLAYLRDAFRGEVGPPAEGPAFFGRFLEDGNLDPAHAPPLGYGHLTTVDEFRTLFSRAFDELALAGVESFTNLHQDRLPALPADAVQQWVDLVEQTGTTSEGRGTSDHLLYVGRKRAALGSS